MKITHKKISPQPNPEDETLVGGADWNDAHKAAGARLLGVGYLNLYVWGWNLRYGGGFMIAPGAPYGHEDDRLKNYFLLYMLPSAGECAGLAGTLNDFYVAFEPLTDFGRGVERYEPPPGYAGLYIDQIEAVYLCKDDEWRTESEAEEGVAEGDEDAALLEVENGEGTRHWVIMGYYYQVTIDADYETDEEEEALYDEYLEKLMQLKISVWKGRPRFAVDGEDFGDNYDPFWMIPDGYAPVVDSGGEA
jgi:hypothetical protein